MSTVKPTNNKSKKYIYTEEDLGEGLLDEGVTFPYELDSMADVKSKKRAYQFTDNNSSIYTPEVPNVQEDLTYAYYC